LDTNQNLQHMFRYFKFVFLGLALSLVACTHVFAQSNMPINIENLTDQQVIILMSQYQLFGLSDLEMEMKAREKGMNADQITLLKKRMSMMDPSLLKEINTPVKTTNDPYEPRTRPAYNKFLRVSVPDTSKALRVFGASIFDNEDLSFEPNVNIATPQGYIIGAGDQLVVDVYGVSDLTKKLKVTSEGDIRFPNLGPIKVSGMNVEDASIKIRRALTKIYPGINNGSVGVQVSVGQIRSIRVSMIGEIKYPGNYDVSSLSTIMNALYTSGGLIISVLLEILNWCVAVK